MTAGPDKAAGNGYRDPTTGRFLPGNNANPSGRPRGFDFRRVVREHAEREGVTVEGALWAIFKAMVKAATAGEVAAAKLVIDRLCDIETSYDADTAARLLATVAAMRQTMGEGGNAGD